MKSICDLYSVLIFIGVIATMFSCSMTEAREESTMIVMDDLPEITNVTCTGQANNYTLNVTIASPDTGCDQYADWWEVFTSDSVLIYRRILTHSHVTEQPFTRSGGLVDVGPDEFIYVRAHMNNLGYGSKVFSGTLRNDLQPDSLDIDFASNLEFQEPLPEDCAF